MRIGLSEIVLIAIVVALIINPNKAEEFGKKVGELTQRFKAGRESVEEIVKPVTDELKEVTKPLQESKEELEKVKEDLNILK